MSNKKQTAVEQLINAIKGQINLNKEHLEMLESYGNQAKQIEREQIEDAYLGGINDAFCLEESLEMDIENSKKYYEQTYGEK